MAQRVMAIEQRMRAHLSAMANFNEDERMIILRAFTQHERAKREAGRYDPPELVTEVSER